MVAQSVEEWLAAAVLLRLDTSEMADVLAGRHAEDEHHASLTAELAAAQDKLTELAEMFGAGEISRAELIAARKTAEKRATDARRQAALDPERDGSRVTLLIQVKRRAARAHTSPGSNSAARAAASARTSASFSARWPAIWSTCGSNGWPRSIERPP